MLKNISILFVSLITIAPQLSAMDPNSPEGIAWRIKNAMQEIEAVVAAQCSALAPQGGFRLPIPFFNKRIEVKKTANEKTELEERQYRRCLATAYQRELALAHNHQRVVRAVIVHSRASGDSSDDTRKRQNSALTVANVVCEQLKAKIAENS